MTTADYRHAAESNRDRRRRRWLARDWRMSRRTGSFYLNLTDYWIVVCYRPGWVMGRWQARVMYCPSREKCSPGIVGRSKRRRSPRSPCSTAFGG
jgi:hypothetical protein